MITKKYYENTAFQKISLLLSLRLRTEKSNECLQPTVKLTTLCLKPAVQDSGSLRNIKIVHTVL